MTSSAFGLIIVTVAAAFSTGSAINATRFATARLAHKVAEEGELPAFMNHRNKEGIPDRAVIILGSVAALLAAGVAQIVAEKSLGAIKQCSIAGRGRGPW